MSDHFRMLVDADVSPDEASAVADAVVAEFLHLGLIRNELSEDCVLGEIGYPPGPRLSKVYKRQPQEVRFWELRTSGVEVEIERSFNFWALGPSFEGFTCPKCSTKLETYDDELAKSLAGAIEEWKTVSGPAELACPLCKESTNVTLWHSKPPLGFGNLSFRFWNWPPFGSSSWRIDLPSLVRKITGHTIIETYGHI